MKRAVIILIVGLILSFALILVRWTYHSVHKKDIHTDSEAKILSMTDSRRQTKDTGKFFPLKENLIQPLKPGDSLPDAVLTDQSGNKFHLSELKGNALVLTFIYTHCNVLSMCPLVTEKLIKAYNLIYKKGISGVKFVLISFDTERDQPEILSEFASRYSTDLSSFYFTTGDANQIADLSYALNTYYRQSAPGVFEHNIVISLFNREGILYKYFFGTEWEEEELISAVKSLI